MDIYISHTSSLESHLIKKYMGGIKDFIAANGDRFVGPIGTVVIASWIPAVNFKAYEYRLTYRTNRFTYPRIPWNGHIAYINSCDPLYSPYECAIVFKEPDANIIATFFLYRANYGNIEECERCTE